MLATTPRHVYHHGRFYLALLLGVGVWIAAGFWSAPRLRLVVAGDVFFGVYLASTALFATQLSTAQLRARSNYEDEGMIVIVLITAAAIVLSLAAIFSLLNRPDPSDPFQLTLALLSVLFGWLTLHTIAAFRYAHLYYARSSRSEGRADAGGLAFPGTPEPTTWDFLYYSFVVGMTAQVSDVDVQSSRMRRLTLAHGIASFFFNTVLLALAINVAASQVH